MPDETPKIFVDSKEIDESDPKHKELSDLAILADKVLNQYNVPETVELLFDAYECKDGMLYVATLVEGKLHFMGRDADMETALKKAVLLWRSEQ